MASSLPSTARSLPIALLRARERVMGPIRAMLADAGITEQQWRVLRVLDEVGDDGGVDPTRIAETACLLLPSLTRILQKLEEKDLIWRERDQVDKRRQIVRITQTGQRLITENRATSLALMDAMRHRLGPEKYETLLDLLNELSEADLRGT